MMLHLYMCIGLLHPYTASEEQQYVCSLGEMPLLALTFFSHPVRHPPPFSFSLLILMQREGTVQVLVGLCSHMSFDP